MLLLTSLGCVSTSNNRNEVSVSNNRNESAVVPTPQSKPETKAKEEKSFSFEAQGGKKITAYVYADFENPNWKMIIFTPFLDKTDGNLYNASLNALWSIYGKKRGLFQLEDAKTEYDSGLGGNAICWGVSNPKQQFCVFPVKDSETGGIGALRVWIK